MTLFALIAAGLVIAVIGGLLPAVLRRQPPAAGATDPRLLHRQRLAELHRDAEDRVIDASELVSAEEEIARALLEEFKAGGALPGEARVIGRRATSAFIICCVPAIALFTYFTLGQPQLATRAPPLAAADQPLDQQTIDAMLASLKERLAHDPDSAEGWLLLGRSYMALARYAEAVPAFARAYELIGEEPQVMLQYADALAMAADGKIGADVRALVARILTLEPDNVAALWLAGLGAAETGDRTTALDYLHKARAAAARDGAPTVELDAILKGLAEHDTATVDAPAATASIRVGVAIAPELVDKIGAEDSVFVFARSPGSSGPPLAVTRAHAHALPLEVVLDDTMAMAPKFRMKAGDTVAITARVSKSGAAVAATGDLQGTSAPFAVGERDAITVLIDQTVE